MKQRNKNKRVPPPRCRKKKCGEYNPLSCALEDGHDGDCCWYPDGDYSKVNGIECTRGGENEPYLVPVV